MPSHYKRKPKKGSAAKAKKDHKKIKIKGE